LEGSTEPQQFSSIIIRIASYGTDDLRHLLAPVVQQFCQGPALCGSWRLAILDWYPNGSNNGVLIFFFIYTISSLLFSLVNEQKKMKKIIVTGKYSFLPARASAAYKAWAQTSCFVTLQSTVILLPSVVWYLSLTQEPQNTSFKFGYVPKT